MASQEQIELVNKHLKHLGKAPLSHRIQWAATFTDDVLTRDEFLDCCVELGVNRKTAKTQYYKTMKENREVEALCECGISQ